MWYVYFLFFRIMPPLIVAVIYFIYSLILNSSSLQGTIGSCLFKLKIVSADGSKIKIKQAFKHSLIDVIPFIVYCFLNFVALSPFLFKFAIRGNYTYFNSYQLITYIITIFAFIYIHSGYSIGSKRIGFSDFYAKTHIEKHYVCCCRSRTSESVLRIVISVAGLSVFLYWFIWDAFLKNRWFKL